LGILQRLFKAKAKTATDTPKLDKRSKDVPVIRFADGFMPMQVFTGGSLQQNLEASIWSYACITQNAEAIASLPCVVEQQHGNDWVRLDAIPEGIKRFIKSPLGYQAAGVPPWSWGHLVETITQHCYLSGNAYLIPIDIADTVAVRLLLEPGSMTADEDDRGYPTEYRYKGYLQYKPDKLVNIMSCHPASYWKGHSPLKVVSSEIDVDKTAAQRIMYNLRNRIGSGLAVMIEGYWGTDDEERKAVLDDLQNNYRLATDDGTPLILGNASALESIPSQGHGVEIYDARRFSRQAITSAFHTPPPMIGNYEKATLNNMREAIKIWWKAALNPMATQIYEAINQQLIWPRWGSDTRLWFDEYNSDIGVALLHDRGETAKVFTDIGVPVNEALNLVGVKLSRHYDELDKPNMILEKAGRNGDDKKEGDDDAK
jgi:phage portal protein BeeE